MPLPADCSALKLPLETSRLTMRALNEADLEDVFVLCSHPEICRYIRPAMTRAQVMVHICERLRPWYFEERKWYSLAVNRKGEKGVIGELVFRLESKADRRAEIGYRFHPQAQGHGYALEAVRAMMNILFKLLDLHKLSAYCDAENLPSIRLLARLGMREEGLRREQMQIHGEWRDLRVYGLLRRHFR